LAGVRGIDWGWFPGAVHGSMAGETRRVDSAVASFVLFLAAAHNPLNPDRRQKMSKFVQVTGWHQQQDFNLTVNFDHVTRITTNADGRAVLHFNDTAITLGVSYASFIAKMEKVESLWATAGDAP
jgi:hypothetical protein